MKGQVGFKDGIESADLPAVSRVQNFILASFNGVHERQCTPTRAIRVSSRSSRTVARRITNQRHIRIEQSCGNEVARLGTLRRHSVIEYLDVACIRPFVK